MMSEMITDGDSFVERFKDYIHSKHLVIASTVPDTCRSEPCLVGIDEAGRGPVLGPMVYGISYCPLSRNEEFASLGCADSKVLTEKRREEVFAILCACDDYVGWSVDIISPNFISNNMLRRSKHSLNEIAQDSTVRLIQNAITSGVQVAEIYVDTVGPPEKYQDRLSKIFPQCKVTVAKKADALFPVVSAASICAKVCRDRTISNWKFVEQVDINSKSYGSGYPNDPETKKFLSGNIDEIFGFPSIVRFSWSTASKMLEDNAATVEWDDEDEEEEKGNIKSFFKSSINQSKHSMKHDYFKGPKVGMAIRRLSANSSGSVNTAILLLNMGGPKTSDQVEEYLRRIMTDRDMIQLPVQGQLGPWIAKRRAPEVAKKYNEIGGGSPILKWTQLQGEKMCEQLDIECPETAPHKPYVGFRYVEPFSETSLKEIERDGAQRVVLFSQYPHYSCATSGSSFNAIYSHYKSKKPTTNMKWSIIDRWSTHPLLAKTFAENIRKELAQFPENIRNDVVILFSAHSLPLKAVNRGDSYPSEVGATVQLVMNELNYSNPYNLVWQSKVGPLPWLAPFTDDAIKAYVKQGKKNIILVPIAFVNEHIETLHEMDIEYCKDLGREVGAEQIRRAAAPNDHPLFIQALTDIVKTHLRGNQRITPKFLFRCPHCTNPKCHQAKSWHEDAERNDVSPWMNESDLLTGDGAPLLTLAHIKKEGDSGSYLPCDGEFIVPPSPGSPDRQFCSSTTQFAGENSGSADNVKEEEGVPRRACLVCGDVASGFHYGVASCEACKAFFKRTIQGNIEYTCPAANDCEINKRRRKACQACRFQKCLRMGMLKEGVRLDRVRGGRQKYRRNADGPYQLQAMPPLKPYSNLEDNKLLEALTLNEPDMSVTTSDIVCTDPVLRTLNVLSDLYDQELVKIITWAKHIPGFSDLSLNDQMRLLQSTWAEVMTLTVAFRSLPTTGELKFAADLLVDEKTARDCGLTELHQQLNYVANRIERLSISKEEYYILKALILANSDVRIEEQQPLKRLRDVILGALTECVAVVRGGTTALHVNQLLLCLPAIRQADHIHRRFWSSIHRDGKVYMNKLFVEMLESYVR